MSAKRPVDVLLDALDAREGRRGARPKRKPPRTRLVIMDVQVAKQR